MYVDVARQMRKEGIDPSVIYRHLQLYGASMDDAAWAVRMVFETEAEADKGMVTVDEIMVDIGWLP